MTVPLGVCKTSASVIFFFYCNVPVCYRSFVWAQDNSGPKIRNFHYGQYILFPFPSFFSPPSLSLPFSLPFPFLFPPSYIRSLCPFLPIPSRHFLSLNPARGSGERCKLQTPAGPGRARPPKAIC